MMSKKVEGQGESKWKERQSKYRSANNMIESTSQSCPFYS